MKAWKIFCRADFYCRAVVFAETSGKAKSLAMRYEPSCEFLSFIELQAFRAPELDVWYHEKPFLDWDDPNDRNFALANGFKCEDAYEPYCVDCFKKDKCEEYADYLEFRDFLAQQQDPENERPGDWAYE